MPPPFTLSWRVYLAVAAVLLLASLTLFFALDGPVALRQWYIVDCLGPSIQAKWGFTGRWVKNGTSEVYCITNIAPGGAFEKAGFKEGDIFTDPWLYHHGTAEYAVLEGLHSICDRPLHDLAVVSGGELSDGQGKDRRVIHLECSTLVTAPPDQ